MVDLTYNHGVRVTESAETPVLVQLAETAVVGIIGTAPNADAVKFPTDMPVLLTKPSDAAALGDGGTLKEAVDGVLDQTGTYIVIVRVAEDADPAVQTSNIIGDATQKTGVHAFLKAEGLFGWKFKPRLLCAPGFTSAFDGTNANPVASELAVVAETLRAIAIVDGPDTTDDAAKAYRTKLNSQRLFIVDPKVMVWSTTLNDYVPQPASARFCGVQARVDREFGFWWSLSNKPIRGITGVTRAIAYGDHANYLNVDGVNTIINTGEGFITWGNRVATGDDLWVFMSVRRTADFINEAIEKAYMEFVDKPFTPANLKFLVESGRAFLRDLQAFGAILGGNVWIDPDKNDDLQMASGRIVLSVEFEPPAPMEDIKITAHRNTLYYDVLLDGVLQELGNNGPLTEAA